VALLESGTLRDCVSTNGDEDFASILPWPNNLFLLTVTGNTLREMLEHGIQNSRGENGGAFLQVSGLSYQYQYYDQQRATATNVFVSLIDAQQHVRWGQHPQDHSRIITLSASNHLAH